MVDKSGLRFNLAGRTRAFSPSSMEYPMLELWYQYHEPFIDDYSISDIILGLSEFILTDSRDTVTHLEHRYLSLHPLLLLELEEAINAFQKLLEKTVNLQPRPLFIIDPTLLLTSTLRCVGTFEELKAVWDSLSRRLHLAREWFHLRCSSSLHKGFIADTGTQVQELSEIEVATSRKTMFSATPPRVTVRGPNALMDCLGASSHRHASLTMDCLVDKAPDFEVYCSISDQTTSSCFPISTSTSPSQAASSRQDLSGVQSEETNTYKYLDGARMKMGESSWAREANGITCTDNRLVLVCGHADPSTDDRLGEAPSIEDSRGHPPSLRTSIEELPIPSNAPPIITYQTPSRHALAAMIKFLALTGSGSCCRASAPSNGDCRMKLYSAVGLAGIIVGGSKKLVSKFWMRTTKDSSVLPPLLDPGPNSFLFPSNPHALPGTDNRLGCASRDVRRKYVGSIRTLMAASSFRSTHFEPILGSRFEYHSQRHSDLDLSLFKKLIILCIGSFQHSFTQVLTANRTALPDNRLAPVRGHAASFPDNRLDNALRAQLLRFGPPKMSSLIVRAYQLSEPSSVYCLEEADRDWRREIYKELDGLQDGGNGYVVSKVLYGRLLVCERRTRASFVTCRLQPSHLTFPLPHLLAPDYSFISRPSTRLSLHISGIFEIRVLTASSAFAMRLSIASSSIVRVRRSVQQPDPDGSKNKYLNKGLAGASGVEYRWSSLGPSSALVDIVGLGTGRISAAGIGNSVCLSRTGSFSATSPSCQATSLPPLLDPGPSPPFPSFSCSISSTTFVSGASRNFLISTLHRLLVPSLSPSHLSPKSLSSTLPHSNSLDLPATRRIQQTLNTYSYPSISSVVAFSQTCGDLASSGDGYSKLRKASVTISQTRSDTSSSYRPPLLDPGPSDVARLRLTFAMASYRRHPSSRNAPSYNQVDVLWTLDFEERALTAVSKGEIHKGSDGLYDGGDGHSVSKVRFNGFNIDERRFSFAYRGLQPSRSTLALLRLLVPSSSSSSHLCTITSSRCYLLPQPSPAPQVFRASRSVFPDNRLTPARGHAASFPDNRSDNAPSAQDLEIGPSRKASLSVRDHERLEQQCRNVSEEMRVDHGRKGTIDGEWELVGSHRETRDRVSKVSFRGPIVVERTYDSSTVGSHLLLPPQLPLLDSTRGFPSSPPHSFAALLSPILPALVNTLLVVIGDVSVPTGASSIVRILARWRLSVLDLLLPARSLSLVSTGFVVLILVDVLGPLSSSSVVLTRNLVRSYPSMLGKSDSIGELEKSVPGVKSSAVLYDGGGFKASELLSRRLLVAQRHLCSTDQGLRPPLLDLRPPPSIHSSSFPSLLSPSLTSLPLLDPGRTDTLYAPRARHPTLSSCGTLSSSPPSALVWPVDQEFRSFNVNTAAILQTSPSSVKFAQLSRSQRGAAYDKTIAPIARPLSPPSPPLANHSPRSRLHSTSTTSTLVVGCRVTRSSDMLSPMVRVSKLARLLHTNDFELDSSGRWEEGNYKGLGTGGLHIVEVERLSRAPSPSSSILSSFQFSSSNIIPPSSLPAFVYTCAALPQILSVQILHRSVRLRPHLFLRSCIALYVIPSPPFLTYFPSVSCPEPTLELLVDASWTLPSMQLWLYAALSRVGGATTSLSHFISLLHGSGIFRTFLLGGKGGIGISPPFIGRRTILWSLRKIDI